MDDLTEMLTADGECGVRLVVPGSCGWLKGGTPEVMPLVWWEHMGVSKNRGILPPKWMVKIMENPIKMDDLGGPPLFLETPICFFCAKSRFLWLKQDLYTQGFSFFE